jgi:RNA polymerase sigma factor (sigma-70 family)
MSTPTMLNAARNDAELVGDSLSGNRDAFEQIVARYQSLVCSLAYSATGSLSQSEDVAQETFIAAWKQLAALREPARLRSWLCAIARNLIHNTLRRQGREPICRAGMLEEIAEPHSPEPLPVEQTISREEEAILWRSLERIPEIYREPLVLFYREHQSIEAVARQLDLSEDAVKQRLSRGRKLLHDEVLAFVEGALERTNPGRAFTLGVLLALPTLPISAKAAAIGVAAAKGGTVAKSAGLMGLFSAVLSPVLVVFGTYLGYRMSLDTAYSEREREFVRKFYRRLMVIILGFTVVFLLMMVWGWRYAKLHPLLMAGLVLGLVGAYSLVTILLSVWCMRERRKLHAGTATPEAISPAAKPAWEYRSKLELLGLPFVHIRIGGRPPARKQFIRAWFAVGDAAMGLLFAFGGMAIAPISMGGLAIGLFSFGGCAVGLLALGGFGVGLWAIGGVALGWQAFGGCAIAWDAASGGCAIAWNVAVGGIAVARDYALGGIAQAMQANNQIAHQMADAKTFFRAANGIAPYLAWLNLLWVIPMVLWWRTVKRNRQQPERVRS